MYWLCLDKKMNVIGNNFQRNYLNVKLFSFFKEDFFESFSNLALQYFSAVLRAPNKVV